MGHPRVRPTGLLLLLLALAVASLASLLLLWAAAGPDRTAASASPAAFPPSSAAPRPAHQHHPQEQPQHNTWKDPQLVDRPEDLEFARSCAFPRPLAHLPFNDALLATLPALDASGAELGWNATDGLLRPGLGAADDDHWHPLLPLIAQGERRFRAQLDGQSTTLAQAEGEYRRRYGGREPPPGFDRWWAFAQEHNILHPNEHAATDLLAPFFALTPADRRARLRRAMEEPAPGSFEGHGRRGMVIVKNDDEGLGWHPLLPFNSSPSHPHGTPRAAPDKRTKAHLALLWPIRHLLPRFEAVLNGMDQPVVLLDPKEGALEDPTAKASNAMNWPALCARRNPSFAPSSQPADAEEVRFVVDTEKASDPCLNPTLLRSHGFYLQNETTSPNALPLTYRQLLPILSLASTPLHADILIPPIGVEGKLSRPADDGGLWEDKQDTLFWRGSATGMQNARENDGRRVWKDAHRPRLSQLANAPEREPGREALVLAPGGRAAWNVQGGWKKWLDVHLASGRWWRWFGWWPERGQQCSWWDGSCRELSEHYSYAPKSPASAAEAHRYALDVDGNSFSARFPRLMRSRALALKSTAFRVWDSALWPVWYGVVPVDVGYGDLHSLLAFFKPTPDLDGAMDLVAREMAAAGRCWQAKTGRVVDWQAYMLRTYLELARLFNEPPEGGDAEGAK